MAGLARYREFLRTPHAAAMLGWSIFARLPTGMASLGLILLVRHAGGSYAEAGAVTAAHAAAIAVGAPYAGRRVDRLGAARVLVPRALLYPAFLGGTALLAVLDAPPLALLPLAAAAGLAMPPVGASLRTLWSTVARGDLAQTAYAVEASFQELLFVVGPLAVAVLAALTPPLGIAGACAVALVGTLGFARLAPVRESVGVEVEGSRRWGALAAPGIRTIVLLSTCMGFAFGAAEIAVVAFADEEGNRALGGIALAAFAGGSLVGGFVTGLRPTRDEPRRLVLSSAVLAAFLGLPLLASSMGMLTALMFLAGLPIAPLVAAAYGVVAAAAAGGSVAEAFAWLSTAVTTGVAAGTVVGGWLVDADGSEASFLLAVGAGAAAFAVGLTFRDSLRPVPAPG
jgi:MFS family permease